MSKFIPWIVALSIVGGAIFAYAQTSTKHEEKISFLASRIEKNEIKQEKDNNKTSKIQAEQYKELTNLFREMDRKLTRALTLLGDEK